ncbi:MAG: hypothetical protein UDG94_07425 [Peptococcaceae bacterium]|nr:hypothetical protein [Peptococcaceae bacterium]
MIKMLWGEKRLLSLIYEYARKNLLRWKAKEEISVKPRPIVSLLFTLMVLLSVFCGARTSCSAVDESVTMGVTKKTAGDFIGTVLVAQYNLHHHAAFENARLAFPGYLLAVRSAPGGATFNHFGSIR